MNHILTETHTIDETIQSIQTALYNDLVSVWATDKIDAYGRVYKNLKNNNGEIYTVAEIWDSTIKKYKEVYYNNQSCFFFIDDNNHNTEDEFEYSTTIKIVFMLNLEDLKTSTERVDSDVQKDAIQSIRELNSSFSIEGIEKNIDDIFRGFKTDGIKWNDIQPLHVFALSGQLGYSINNKCN